MRFQLIQSVFALWLSAGDSFTASPTRCCVPERTVFFSTTNTDHAVETKQATQQGITTADIEIDIADIFPMTEAKESVEITSEEYTSRLNRQLARLREKDQTSKQLSKEVCCFVVGE